MCDTSLLYISINDIRPKVICGKIYRNTLSSDFLQCCIIWLDCTTHTLLAIYDNPSKAVLDSPLLQLLQRIARNGIKIYIT